MKEILVQLAGIGFIVGLGVAILVAALLPIGGLALLARLTRRIRRPALRWAVFALLVGGLVALALLLRMNLPPRQTTTSPSGG